MHTALDCGKILRVPPRNDKRTGGKKPGLRKTAADAGHSDPAEHPGQKIVAARLRKGLNQSDLARAVEISRQSLFQIEAGSSLPRVDTALRIARVLDADVESLFGGDGGGDIFVDAKGLSEGMRVDLISLDGRWVAHPSDDPERLGAGFSSSDGVLKAVPSGLSVSTRTPLATLSENVFVAGCDPALEMLAQEATRATRRGRCIWIPCGNTAALQRLVRGEAQVAGIHFGGETDEANLAAIRSHGLHKTCMVLRFSSWEQGWMLNHSAKKKFQSIESLSGKGLRLVNREEGSGCRIELDEMLKKSGLPPGQIRGYASVATNHAGSARRIASGFADVGLGCGSMARAFGLDFLPTALVAFDLVIRRDQIEKPIIRAICESLQSGSFQRKLAGVPGYETAGSGRILIT